MKLQLPIPRYMLADRPRFHRRNQIGGWFYAEIPDGHRSVFTFTRRGHAQRFADRNANLLRGNYQIAYLGYSFLAGWLEVSQRNCHSLLIHNAHAITDMSFRAARLRDVIRAIKANSDSTDDILCEFESHFGSAVSVGNFGWGMRLRW